MSNTNTPPENTIAQRFADVIAAVKVADTQSKKFIALGKALELSEALQSGEEVPGNLLELLEPEARCGIALVALGAIAEQLQG